MLWECSSDEYKEKLNKIVESANREGVKEWIRNHPELQLGDQPIKYLRDKAQKLRIKNYSRLSKDELIREIDDKGTNVR